MQIHQLIKNTITEHKNKIELTQWAIISGISSLVYSDYIRHIKHKETPVRIILVPKIQKVKEFLKPDSTFMQRLSNELIEGMANHFLMQQFSDAPELVMFHEDNIEIMKTIFDLYIIPNISRRIPETIALKFRLNDDTQQTFREDWEIDVFNFPKKIVKNDDSIITEEELNKAREDIDDNIIDFIIEESVLQLLMLIPTMKKEIEIPEENPSISMCDDEIFTVANENAVCPIHFNTAIINNKSVINLLSFVTNTNFNRLPNISIAPCKQDYRMIDYNVSTGIFNQVALSRLIEIDYDKERD